MDRNMDLLFSFPTMVQHLKLRRASKTSLRICLSYRTCAFNCETSYFILCSFFTRVLFYVILDLTTNYGSLLLKFLLGAEQRKSPLQRAMYEYLRGKMLDVFPEYRKEAEDHLSKAVNVLNY